MPPHQSEKRSPARIKPPNLRRRREPVQRGPWPARRPAVARAVACAARSVVRCGAVRGGVCGARRGQVGPFERHARLGGDDHIEILDHAPRDVRAHCVRQRGCLRARRAVGEVCRCGQVGGRLRPVAGDHHGPDVHTAEGNRRQRRHQSPCGWTRRTRARQSDACTTGSTAAAATRSTSSRSAGSPTSARIPLLALMNSGCGRVTTQRHRRYGVCG